MGIGIHSSISSLQTRLFLRWVPKWYGAFCDPSGGFYERLASDFKPIMTGKRRLLSQCRQLAIYSDWTARGNHLGKIDLKNKFEHIINRYHNPQSGFWHFSLDDDGKVADENCDLYALAFVMFSFSHYFKASGDDRAKKFSKQVLNLIHTKFRKPGVAGFQEALDKNGEFLKQIRRQNPHMHVLEACLFAHNTWGDDAYMDMADELTQLFKSNFYDAYRKSLIEFFEDDLKTPYPEKGYVYEPGHYFEWVWLLKKHADAKKQSTLHDDVVFELLEFANEYGWDSKFGGIYDSVSEHGDVIADTKRLWPFCEALKANAVMLELVPDRQVLKDRTAGMVAVFLEKYIKERGFWTEWLNQDLTPAVDYMPATTPYHVYFGITETSDILNRRGRVKSFSFQLKSMVYKGRRKLSGLVRRVRDFNIHGG